MTNHDKDCTRVIGSCAGIAVAFGLAEWALTASGGAGLPFADAQRALVAIVLAYGIAGTLLGLVLERWIGERDRSARATCATLALLLTVRVAQDALQHSWALVFGALALGFALYRVGCAVLTRVPQVGRVSFGWAVAVAVWILVSAAQWTAAPDDTSRVALAGAALAALVLTAWSLRSAAWRFAASGVLLAGALFLGLRLPDETTQGSAPADAPCVLLVTIDTLRADHVGAYGSESARTPRIDALASEGTLFRQAVTQNVFTGPSHTSILTGLLPEHHGVVLNEMRVPGRIPTLANLLDEAGWSTAAFVGGYTTTDASCGLPARFGYHDDDLRSFRLLPERLFGLGLLRPVKRALARAGVEVSLRWPLYRQADDVNDPAIEWLARERSAPFFLWAHYFDPHLPYQPPERFLTESARAYHGPAKGHYYRLNAAERGALVSAQADVDQMIDLYDAEVAFADEQFGRLVDSARSAAGDRGLLIVLTSDHGESMGEHGLYWNRDLYDETLLVPLIVVTPTSTAPSAGGAEVANQVRLIDITPSILELAGLEPREGLDGRSFAGLLRGEPDPEPRAAHSGVYRFSDDYHRASFSVRSQGWKLLTRPPGWLGGHFGPWVAGERELYDLSADPAELESLATARPEQVERLEDELRSLQRTAGSVGVDLGQEARDLLRSLGY